MMKTEGISLGVRRPFSWRALFILVVLQLLGNLAVLPLRRATNAPVEPVSAWILWTAVSVPIIAIGLALAARIGLGAPLVEGQLGRGETVAWGKRVLALTGIIAIIGSVPYLLINLDIDPAGYPPSWTLLLASVQAGVREEIFSRLLVMTFLAWLGSLVWRDAAGRPTRAVMWAAVILAGLVFGWGHINSVAPTPDIYVRLLAILLVNTLLGVAFGWLCWQHGLESAILAHFLIDAVGSGLVIPAYLSHNPAVYLPTALCLILVLVLAWRALTRRADGPPLP